MAIMTNSGNELSVAAEIARTITREHDLPPGGASFAIMAE